MILGASKLQLPAIVSAKKMGHEVISVDKDPNAIGFNYSDIALTISTVDTESILLAAHKHDIDAIMTIASDMPMRTVATVAESMNLIGISKETAMLATNKLKMREVLLEKNVSSPKFYKVDSYESYKHATKMFLNNFIVKPADSSGSRGVFLVTNEKETELAFEYSKEFSPSGELIVEEFMEGPEVSVELMAYKGEIHVIAITDKITSGAPLFVEMGHIQPSRLNKNLLKQIEEVAVNAARAVGILIGPSHVEIIVTSEGPKIVEIGARLGGDNIATHLVPLSTGIDIVKSSIEISLGQEPNFKRIYEKASSIKYFHTKTGIISDVIGIEQAQSIEGIKEITFSKKVGEHVGSIKNSSDRIGYIISQAEDAYTAKKRCDMAMEIVKIQIKK